MKDQIPVSLRSISKKFGRVTALDNVSIEIEAGQIVGLIGDNGSGKSTMLRHIVGVYLPTSGISETFGVPSHKMDGEILERIGYVNQESSFISWMKVRDLIEYVSLFYKNWNKNLVNEYVRDFEIQPEKRISALSPGEVQRVSILLGIAYEPELLVLDEPAASLDPIARCKFLDTIMNIIQRDNRTVIISSHILTDIEKIVDRIVILKKGRILENCPFDDLRDRYVELTFTAIGNGTIPEKIPLKTVGEIKRDKNCLIAVIEGAGADMIEDLSAKLSCEIKERHLTLDEIYCIMAGKEKAGGDR
jgi:ABC-2 type transport system ATP-binding protein